MFDEILAPRHEAFMAFVRARMIQDQVEARGVKDPRVLAAMCKVCRHKFVPEAMISRAYEDYPLPIERGQTISQPYIVALMSEMLGLKGGERVLEIGTGSGYQAAVLAELAAEVFTVELFPDLAAAARARLEKLGCANVSFRTGDGAEGWPEKAPFDAVLLTCAAPEVPQALKRQLKDGGRLVAPVGGDLQELLVLRRRGEAFEEERGCAVRFVPMLKNT